MKVKKEEDQEAQWQTREDPVEMLKHLTHQRIPVWSGGVVVRHLEQELYEPKVSDRKLRLFACACLRATPETLCGSALAALRLAEDRADSDDKPKGVGRELPFPRRRSRGLVHPAILACLHVADAREQDVGKRDKRACTAAADLHWEDGNRKNSITSVLKQTNRLNVKPAMQAALLREVVGNPFQTVTLPPGPLVPPDDWECKVCGARPDCEGEVTHGKGCYVLYEDGGGTEIVDLVPGPSRVLSMPDVLLLASAAYSERLDDGTLDPARLAVLSDALEDAGCDSEPILMHLRRPATCVWCGGTGKVARPIKMGGPEGGLEVLYVIEPPSTIDVPCFCGGECGPHVRGCWALDLILGKE